MAVIVITFEVGTGISHLHFDGYRTMGL